MQPKSTAQTKSIAATLNAITEFNSVYVVESLKDGKTHTGRSLYDGVLVEEKKKTPWLDIAYFPAPDAQSFWDALHEVRARARAGRLPILHIEAHGSRVGIHLADDSVVRWEEMRDILTAINKATGFRLLVVMAMCKGAYLATVLRPPQPAPAWAVIGPEVDIDDLPMEEGMWMQYAALLSGQGGTAALESLNEAQTDPAQRYHLRSAEELFHYAVWSFFQNRTPEIVKEHENLLVAESTRDWGYGLDVAMTAREVANRRLSDDTYWYNFWRPHFLMIDEFPDAANRFSLTYEDYKAARDSMAP